jgi:glutaredoxin
MKPGRRSLLVLVLVVLAASSASEWSRGREQARLGALIASASGEGDIEMLSSRGCAFCARASQWFGEHGVPVRECLIESDADCAQRYAALGAPGTPVLVVRGQVQLGFDPQAIARALSTPGIGHPGGTSPG